MTPRVRPPTTDGLLLTLAYELLDAHLDTIELRLSDEGELRWRAHLDYLRALLRTAEAIFVRASS